MDEIEQVCKKCGSKKRKISMGMGYYECPDCGKVLEKSRK